MKKHLAQYEINILGLDEKRHQFDFEGGAEFFESFDQDIVENGRFKLNLELDKTATMMRLHFDLNGSVELVCDRSLEVFEEPIRVEEKYIYKFGDRNEVVSEDVEIIPFGASEINIANLIFDFICLAVPMKKLHPRYREESDDDDGYYYSDSIEEKIKPKEERNEEVDPRWEALKSLKKKL